jgi:MFS family permease
MPFHFHSRRNLGAKVWNETCLRVRKNRVLLILFLLCYKYFRFANFFGCVTCFLVPLAAYLNFYALFWLRLIQGLVAGAAWPAMSHMVGE